MRFSADADGAELAEGRDPLPSLPFLRHERRSSRSCSVRRACKRTIKKTSVARVPYEVLFFLFGLPSKLHNDNLVPTRRWQPSTERWDRSGKVGEGAHAHSCPRPSGRRGGRLASRSSLREGWRLPSIASTRPRNSCQRDPAHLRRACVRASFSCVCCAWRARQETIVRSGHKAGAGGAIVFKIEKKKRKHVPSSSPSSFASTAAPAAAPIPPMAAACAAMVCACCPNFCMYGRLSGPSWLRMPGSSSWSPLTTGEPLTT